MEYTSGVSTIAAHGDTLASDMSDMAAMVAELHTLRYRFDESVRLSTQHLMTRIAMLESANTHLCAKLAAQAQREAPAFHLSSPGLICRLKGKQLPPSGKSQSSQKRHAYPWKLPVQQAGEQAEVE